MRISKKKVMHMYDLLKFNMIPYMKRYKILEDLKLVGISVDENTPIDLDTLRNIYKRVCVDLCSKYQSIIESEIRKGCTK